MYLASLLHSKLETIISNKVFINRKVQLPGRQKIVKENRKKNFLFKFKKGKRKLLEVA